MCGSTRPADDVQRGIVSRTARPGEARPLAGFASSPSVDLSALGAPARETGRAIGPKSYEVAYLSMVSREICARLDLMIVTSTP